MALIPWRNKIGENGGRGEASPISELRGQMDRLFDTFMRDPWGSLSEGLGGARGWAPTLDIAEDEHEVTVRAEVPGIKAADLDITVSGDTLTISGEKKESLEKKDKDYHHVESRYGSFRRSVPLPSGIDPNQVTADYADGVLTIRLKKSPSAQPKKIDVKVPGQDQ